MAIKVRGLRFRPPKLDGGQLQKIGEEMVAVQKDRISRAITADGNPAPPLNQGYAIRKKKYLQKRGISVNRPKRDWSFSGESMENFTLRKALDGVIRAAVTTTKIRNRLTLQKVQMIGFSPVDLSAVFKGAQREYGKWAKGATIPVSR